MAQQLLVVDDDPTIRTTLQQLFEQNGYQVRVAADAAAAKELFSKKGTLPDACLLDVCLPDMDGLQLLNEVRPMAEETAFVIITAHGTVAQSVEAMKHGAADYVLKPFNIDEIVLRVQRALDKRRLKAQVTYLENRVYGQWEADFVTGGNPTMKKIHEGLDRIAQSNSTTVFIHGETGTGKEVIARRIHSLSPRANKPFVDINATALTAELLESELFGHEAGSFTGATKMKKGLFEVASGGTLFLDEIGDMELSMQAKLLRALQERKIRRVGGTEAIEIDIRLITATNQNLERLVAEGRFREDLFYRLNVVPVTLPPLRERPEDVEAFARHFVAKFNKEFGREVFEIDSEALKTLRGYAWPGNVRELRNVIERSVLLECDGNVLKSEHLRLAGSDAPRLTDDGNTPVLGATVPLETIERQHISGVLRTTGGNKNQAAKILGIDRTTLYNKIKKYQIPS